MLVRQFYPWIGGTEQQAQKLSIALANKGVDIHVSTGWWFKDTPRFEFIDNLPINRNFTAWEMFGIRGLRKFGGYLYMLTLANYLWRNRDNYYLIHIHGLNYHSIVGIVVGHWLGKKTLMKLACGGAGSDIIKMKSNKFLYGTKQMLPLARTCDCVVAINEDIAAELVDYDFESTRIFCLPNGVVVPDKPAKRSHEKRCLRIVFVGRLHPQKGIDVLIEALGLLKQHYPELKWMIDILGKGNLLPELKERCEVLGIVDQVKFHGAVVNVNDYLERADIFVLPSRAEGISNALLEAMALGLPCVATCVSGNTTVVEHNKDALLVEPESPLALSKGLATLIEDESLRLKLGQAARQKIEQSYSIDAVAESYLELYEKMLTASNLVVYNNSM